MRFFKEISLFFSSAIILGCVYASEQKETIVFSKPQEYYVYSSTEGSNAPRIKVGLDTLNLFESLKSVLEDIPYNREENFNKPIEFPLVCSSQALQKIFGQLLSVGNNNGLIEQKINALCLQELVETNNCVHALILSDTRIRGYFLQALADKILDIVDQFNRYIPQQGLYPLPDYEPLRFLDDNILKTNLYDIQQTLWNRLKKVSFYLSGNPDQYIVNWQNKPIATVFDEISSQLKTKSNSQEEVKEEKDRNFNYKAWLFAAFLAATIAGGKKLWDLYKTRLDSQ